MKYSIKKAIEETQTFLQRNSHQHFEEMHGIRCKTDGMHIILNYDITKVNWNEPYGYVCRGLVLDAETFDVLGFGLPKFFNSGENWVDKIDWETAIVLEKLDGTMFNRWFSPHFDEFVITTRFQLPDEIITNKIMQSDVTWAQLFRMATKGMGIDRVSFQAQDETVAFEVCSPFNQVVVQYPEPTAAVICRRNHDDLEEHPLPAEPHRPLIFSLNNQIEVQEFAAKLDGKEHEGFVVVDEAFNRMKIKTPSWKVFCNLSQAVHSSIRCQVEAVMDEKNDVKELAKDFPYVGKTLLRIQEIITEIMNDHQAAYRVYRDIENQKQFAIAVTDTRLPFSSILFAMRSGKISSVEEGFYKLQSSHLAKIVAEKLELQFIETDFEV